MLNPANYTQTYNPSTGGDNGTYRLFTVSNLVAPSASTSLELHGRQDPGGLNIDNVAVDFITAAVPEPATWAMMILGMGAIGFALRRQKVTTRVSYAA